MRKFFESLMITVPYEAVSYSTEGRNKIIFLIGKTGQFSYGNLTEHQVSEMKRAGRFGSFGWAL